MHTKNCIKTKKNWKKFKTKNILNSILYFGLLLFFHNFFTPYILDKVVGGTDFFMYTFGGIAPCFSNSKFLMCISIFG